jgi:hypothetical protein
LESLQVVIPQRGSIARELALSEVEGNLLFPSMSKSPGGQLAENILP